MHGSGRCARHRDHGRREGFDNLVEELDGSSRFRDLKKWRKGFYCCCCFGGEVLSLGSEGVWRENELGDGTYKWV